MGFYRKKAKVQKERVQFTRTSLQTSLRKALIEPFPFFARYLVLLMKGVGGYAKTAQTQKAR